MNLVAFFQQQFRQVGAIVAGDTGYYGFLHGEAGGRLERRERVGAQRDGGRDPGDRSWVMGKSAERVRKRRDDFRIHDL